MKSHFFKFFLLGKLLIVYPVLAQGVPSTIVVNPKASTSAVIDDADDPAIWVHPDNPSQAIIIGTDKGSFPDGGLFVWNMDGTLHQHLAINHPNNVDVRYGMQLQSGVVDIAVASMREDAEIRVFKIDPVSRMLSDITTAPGITVFSDPYGICLYRRPSDGAMFVVLSSNGGNTLWQLLLEDDGTGKVRGTKVREFGTITGLVEGIVADDELGYIYAAEEGLGVHKFHADPALGNARLALFATADGISGEREGMAIYSCADGTGYLLLSNQGETDNNVKVYPREGAPGNPHQHNLVTTIVTNGSASTDGLDVTNRPTSGDFGHGFLITHNSPGTNFRLYAWEDIAQSYLTVCTSPVGVDDRPGGGPTEFMLEQNYPNPFNASTKIGYRLSQSGQAVLIIYTLLGQEIRHLVNTQHAVGRYSVLWDGRDDNGLPVPTGIYLYRARFDNHNQVRRMLLLR